jgi:hypothetical protein
MKRGKEYFYMSIEDDIYEQGNFWGNDPEFPPNHQFAGFQWEAIAEKVIVEEEEQPRAFRQSKFQEDFLEGWI